MQRVIGVGPSRPDADQTWDDLQRHASDVLETARGRLHFETKEGLHRRGQFTALAVGISFGGGQKHPKALAQDRRNRETLEGLLNQTAFKRISGFATGRRSRIRTLCPSLTYTNPLGVFAGWAPRLYEYQTTYLSRAIAHDQGLRQHGRHPKPNEEELRRNWPQTPWAATTFNFGPQTVCFKHVDYHNLAFGWCSITALGEFDHKKGGHLVLWELGLVIEFPAGTTMLIPSATIHHSNTCIDAKERRYSFTQYTAGGIFRYVDNDYQTVEDRVAGLDCQGRALRREKLSKQLKEGLALYSDIPELERTRGMRFRMRT